MIDESFSNPLGFEQAEMPAEQKDAFEKIALERYEYCKLLARVFKSDDGKKVLKNLREQTIEAACWSPSIAQSCGLAEANAHAYAREGQNALVRNIEDCIRIAHECKTLEEFSAKINMVDAQT